MRAIVRPGGQRRVKLGAALYAGWVALVITGVVGGLDLAFQSMVASGCLT